MLERKLNSLKSYGESYEECYEYSKLGTTLQKMFEILKVRKNVTKNVRNIYFFSKLGKNTLDRKLERRRFFLQI